MKELTLREMQLKELDMLSVFDDICKQYGLKYTLAYGTLLGAVRHKGFIPWDDDMDIAMPRPDYERLVGLLNSNELSLPDNYEFTDDRANRATYPFLKIIDKNIKIESKIGEVIKYLWIDIFPIDGYSADDKATLKLIRKIKWAKRMLLYNNATFSRHKGIKKIAALMLSVIAKMYGIKRANRKLNCLAQTYQYEHSDYVGVVCWANYGIGERIDKSNLEDYTQLEFEGKKFWVLSGYENYLTSLYGDYMQLPPEEKRHTHSVKAFILN